MYSCVTTIWKIISWTIQLTSSKFLSGHWVAQWLILWQILKRMGCPFFCEFLPFVGLCRLLFKFDGVFCGICVFVFGLVLIFVFAGLWSSIFVLCIACVSYMAFCVSYVIITFIIIVFFIGCCFFGKIGGFCFNSSFLNARFFCFWFYLFNDVIIAYLSDCKLATLRSLKPRRSLHAPLICCILDQILLQIVAFGFQVISYNFQSALIFLIFH